MASRQSVATRELQNRKNMKRIFYIIGIVAALASCSKEEAAGERLPEGEQPLKLIATMQEQTPSRATSENSWDGAEQVAVEIGGLVKKHIADAYGELNVEAGISPWYWLSNSERKGVTAWHPYSSSQPTSFSVLADQTTPTKYQASDMIYAVKQITFADQTLIFQHLPAKLVVNLTAGEGITPAEVHSATVSLMNQATTSGEIAANWNVAQVTAGSETITPDLSYTPLGYNIRALLVPQQMQGKRFIKVSIGKDAAKRDFYYTPTGVDDANLTAGKLHTLNLFVKSSGLEFSSSTVEQWDDTQTGEGEVGPPPPAKVGDYYYADGTYSTDFKGTTSNPCIGVIYTTDGMTGMVVSLDETNTAWSDFDADTHATDWNQGKRNRTAIQSYINNNSDKSWDNFPAFKWCNDKNEGGDVDWYLPAKSELSALYTAYDGYGKATFNGRFTADGVGGTAFVATIYWSSSESLSHTSWDVSFGNGYTVNYTKTSNYRVRCVRAF